MDFLTAADLTLPNGETTRYYHGGSEHGIPLIFIHGWPDLAQSWHHQLRHFSKGPHYRVLALDMRGYGHSSAPTDKRAYSLQALSSELTDFAAKLGIQSAIWVGHDWGCGVLSALAAHRPDLFLGLALLSVPYRTLELGVDHLVSLVNRDIYPESEYPYGQWEYMKCYERFPEESVKAHASAPIDRVTRVRYAPHDASQYGQPAHTSRTLRTGWFGGHPERLPDVPLERTSLDDSLYAALLDSFKKHGFFPPTAYYLNHDVNAEFAGSAVNGGVIEFPLLYIDSKHDAICSPSTTPGMGEGQKVFAKDLTVETVEAAHWVMLEKPAEVIDALEKWLARFEGGR